MKLTKSMLNKLIQEAVASGFEEGEVIDFKKRKMLDLQRKMMNEPAAEYIVDIEPWGKLISHRFDVALEFAQTSKKNGFKLKGKTSPEILKALEKD